jgi:eukaryotic-like serine/threonine-protein kinase
MVRYAPASMRAPELPSRGGANREDSAGPNIAQVLRSEEAARARVFFRSFLLLALAVEVFVPFLGGPTTLRAAVGVVTAVGALLCAVALRALRDEARYTPERATLIGVGCAVVGVLIVYYVGLFSAAAMVLALGLYFFGSSHHRVSARATFLTLFVNYFLLTVALAADLIPDVGLFPIAGVAPVTRWFQVIMSQLILGITFFIARRNRRVLENAIDRVNQANMQVRQRDAQLAEARRELDHALRPGDGRHTGTRLGDFLLGTLIGRGAMGEVYRAAHAETGMEAAIKVLHPDLIESEEHIRRFLREAEMAARVRSPHVIELRGSGRSDTGAPFLVMELLEGHDLGWQLRRSGRLPLPAVVELIDQLCRALVTLREAGIVHRDLKPANIFLARSIPYTWKVLDFGLSKVLGRNSSLTRGQALGTPGYMAPEQVGGDVGDRTDLYAAAAIAYRALTGSPPFDGEDVLEVFLKVLYDEPAHPTRFVRLPSDVELVLAIGLAKSPAERFATAEELALALRRAAAGDLDDTTRIRGWGQLKRAPWGSTRRPARPPLVAQV